MIVEFVGSTGAGKTTLISQVQKSLARTVRVTSSYELIAGPLGLSEVKQPTARNLLQESVGLPYFLRSLPRHKRFLTFTLRMLARQADLSVFTINNLRSVVRKLGVYEIGRRRKREQIVLVDEGTVLAAHVIFVYSSAVYTPAEIREFAALVPLPDLIVYVAAPLESMVERTLQRVDPPRELNSKDPLLVEKQIAEAIAVFEQLLEVKRIGRRTLVVQNPDSAEKDHDAVVDHVSELLLRCYNSYQNDTFGEAALPADRLFEQTSHVT